jgi:two-component system phosphate regulon sensor histidine kinase PhoR
MIVGEGRFPRLLLGMLFLTFRAVRSETGLARTQRNFLMAVTHELRTPIAAIKLAVTDPTLAKAFRPDQQATWRCTPGGDRGRSLERLLADKVLMATRAEDGVISLDLKLRWT